jgi:very-short-patch-repair endonuclease
VAIETDGEEAHGTRVAFQRDRRRNQVLVAAGYRTARVTWRQMEEEPSQVIERIGRMLRRGCS